MNKIETIKIGRYWYVREQKTYRVFDRYTWKYPAVSGGRTLAKYLGVEHVIKDRHGVVRSSNSYGNDPVESKN